MSIILVTATSLEMEAVLVGVMPRKVAAELAASLAVHSCALQHSTTPISVRGHTLFLLTCGVGPVSAALHLGLTLGTLHKTRAALTGVLNLGIAGTYDPLAAPLGSVVQASCEIFPEFGLHTGAMPVPHALGFPQVQLPEGDVFDRVPSNPGKYFTEYSGETPQPENSSPAHLALQKGLGNMGLNCHSLSLRGPSVTVSGVSGNANRAAQLAERTGGLTENMEGFALALGAARCGLAFAEIRAVSNMVGHRPPDFWDMPAALAALTETTRNIFQE